jgi:hypothetical protein
MSFRLFILARLGITGSPRKGRTIVALSDVKHTFVKTWAQAAHGTVTRWVGEPGASLLLYNSLDHPPCFKFFEPAALINACVAFYAEILKHCLPYVWPPRNIVASG